MRWIDNDTIDDDIELMIDDAIELMRRRSMWLYRSMMYPIVVV